MGAPGEGYRYTLGVAVLVVHVLVFVAAWALVALRAQYQPVRTHSPAVLLALTAHMIPLAVLVPLREMAVWSPALSCEHVGWLTVLSVVWLCVPQGAALVRLYVVFRAEKEKARIATGLLRHAGSPAHSPPHSPPHSHNASTRALLDRVHSGDGGTTSPDDTAAGAGAGTVQALAQSPGTTATAVTAATTTTGLATTTTGQTHAPAAAAAAQRGMLSPAAARFVERRTTLFMLAMLVGATVPPCIYVPVFFAADHQYDWSARDGCTHYHSRLAALWFVAIGTLTVTGLSTSRWTADVRNDAWHIRWHLNANVVCCHVTSLVLIVVNAVSADVNRDAFDTMYLVELWSLVTVAQMVLRPCLQTFWTKQRRVGRTRRTATGSNARYTVRNGHGSGPVGGRFVKPGTSPGGANGQPSPNQALHHTWGAGGTDSGRTNPNAIVGGGHRYSPNGAHHHHHHGGGRPHSAMGDSRSIEVSRGGTGSRGSPGRGHTHGTGSTAGGPRLTLQQQFAHRPLMKLLSHPDGLRAFLAYTQSEFSGENVLFHSTVTEFRSAPTLASAQLIVATFVGSRARMQVNLSAGVVRGIVDALEAERDRQRVLHADANVAIPGTIQATSGGASASAAAAAALASTPVGTTPTAGAGPQQLASPTQAGSGANGVAAAPGPLPSPSVAGTERRKSLTVPAIAGFHAVTTSPTAGGTAKGPNGFGAATDRFSFLFDDALREVFLMLESDSFARFVLTANGRATMEQIDAAAAAQALAHAHGGGGGHAPSGPPTPGLAVAQAASVGGRTPRGAAGEPGTQLTGLGGDTTTTPSVPTRMSVAAAYPAPLMTIAAIAAGAGASGAEGVTPPVPSGPPLTDRSGGSDRPSGRRQLASHAHTNTLSSASGATALAAAATGHATHGPSAAFETPPTVTHAFGERK